MREKGLEQCFFSETQKHARRHVNPGVWPSLPSQLLGEGLDQPARQGRRLDSQPDTGAS